MKSFITLTVFVIQALLPFGRMMAQNRNEELRLLRENRVLRQQVDSLRRLLDRYEEVDGIWARLDGLESEDSSWGNGVSSLEAVMPEQERLAAARLAEVFPETGVRYDRRVLVRMGEYSRGRNAAILAGALGRMGARMPFFKSVFEKYGVPAELIPLCVVESAASPNAVSPVGAAGMWQLMPATAEAYGLRVDADIDERFSVEKSTDAAARHLRDLKRSLGTWPLAVMAYNCGAPRVRKAVIATGSTDPWTVMERLPAETRAYLPSLLAVGLLAAEGD